MNLSISEQRVATAGGALFVRQWCPEPSSGVPVLLLHDSLGCVELWREFPEQLARTSGRRVIAYDRLGFGRSDAHPGLLRPGFVENEAQEGFSAVLEALDVDEFVVFGHSVGGGMAVSCAARYPTRCQALITESAQAFAEARTLDGIRAAQQQFADPSQFARLSRYHGDKAEWVLRAWVDNWLSEAFADWNLDQVLSRVRCPLLSLHGDNDEFGSEAHPSRLTRQTGGVSLLKLISGCGHVPHREQPGQVLAAVADFLR
ncbi:alpha/beta fold hydrolase [Pseudomonas putida]|uniref:alpha/beta fold hydrolase n=1 Tax=Pseudomonas putida TaxID=303 RepID=UPI00383B934D